MQPTSSPFLSNVVSQDAPGTHQATAAASEDMPEMSISPPGNEEEPQQVDQAYMYMSHYSTPGIVFYYLIRRYPSYLIQL